MQAMPSASNASDEFSGTSSNHCYLCNVGLSKDPKNIFLSYHFKRPSRARPIEAKCFDDAVRDNLMFEMLYKTCLERRASGDSSTKKKKKRGFQPNTKPWPKWEHLPLDSLVQTRLCDKCSCCFENQCQRGTFPWKCISICNLEHVVSEDFLSLCTGIEGWSGEGTALNCKGLTVEWKDGCVVVSTRFNFYRKHSEPIASLASPNETLESFLIRAKKTMSACNGIGEAEEFRVSTDGLGRFDGKLVSNNCLAVTFGKKKRCPACMRENHRLSEAERRMDARTRVVDDSLPEPECVAEKEDQEGSSTGV